MKSLTLSCAHLYTPSCCSNCHANEFRKDERISALAAASPIHGVWVALEWLAILRVFGDTDGSVCIRVRPRRRRAAGATGAPANAAAARSLWHQSD